LPPACRTERVVGRDAGLAREAERRQDDIEGPASNACEAPKMLQTPRARRFDAVIIENGFLHAHYTVGIAET
jgi:hypothetical protein